MHVTCDVTRRPLKSCGRKPSFRLPTTMSINAPDPSSSALPTVPTISSTIPDATKRKIDEILATFPVTEPTRKRAKRSLKYVHLPPTHYPHLILRSAPRSPAERLQAASKFFVRAVNPFMDIGTAMRYGSEHHWGTPVEATASNTVTIPASYVIIPHSLSRVYSMHISSEVVLQNNYIKAFDSIFANVPELLDAVKYIYLEIPEKPEQWNQLIAMVRRTIVCTHTVDTCMPLDAEVGYQRTNERHGRSQALP